MRRWNSNLRECCNKCAHYEDRLSQRLIARALGVVRSTVERVLKRFAEARLNWPPDPAFAGVELEQPINSLRRHRVEHFAGELLLFFR